MLASVWSTLILATSLRKVAYRSPCAVSEAFQKQSPAQDLNSMLLASFILILFNFLLLHFKAMLHFNSNITFRPVIDRYIPFTLCIQLKVTIIICQSLLGSPVVTSLRYDSQSRTLTCTSTGGPATTVTWRRDGVVITLNATHQQTKRVVDPVMSTYQTILTIDPSVDQGSIVGSYCCIVENARGRSSRTVIVGKLTLKYTSCCYPHYITT